MIPARAPSRAADVGCGAWGRVAGLCAPFPSSECGRARPRSRVGPQEGAALWDCRQALGNHGADVIQWLISVCCPLWALVTNGRNPASVSHTPCPLGGSWPLQGRQLAPCEAALGTRVPSCQGAAGRLSRRGQLEAVWTLRTEHKSLNSQSLPSEEPWSDRPRADQDDACLGHRGLTTAAQTRSELMCLWNKQSPRRRPQASTAPRRPRAQAPGPLGLVLQPLPLRPPHGRGGHWGPNSGSDWPPGGWQGGRQCTPGAGRTARGRS